MVRFGGEGGLSQDTDVLEIVDSEGNRLEFTEAGGKVIVTLPESGGSLPEWWVVDSTPGAENVSFNSTSAATDYNDLFRLAVAEGDIFYVDSAGDADWHFRDSGVAFDFNLGGHKVVRIRDVGLTVGRLAGGGGGYVLSANDEGGTLSLGDSATEIGFFGAPSAPKPTGVAVTPEGIHAALVTLGMIAA